MLQGYFDLQEAETITPKNPQQPICPYGLRTYWQVTQTQGKAPPDIETAFVEEVMSTWVANWIDEVAT